MSVNSNTVTGFAKSVLENRALSSILALTLWFVAVLSGSASVMIACGLLIFARPMLYIAVLNAKERAQKTGTSQSGFLSLIRPPLPQSTYNGTWTGGGDTPVRLR